MSDTPTPRSFDRHDWLWLKAECPHVRFGVNVPGQAEEIERWSRSGRPFVVTRQSSDDVGGVRLGLALPGKRRMAFRVPLSSVARHCAPPPLRDVISVAPPKWRPDLADLADRFESASTTVRTYGSLAWQYFAGDAALKYVAAASDVDLLIYPRTRSELRSMLDILLARPAVPRLDGEAVFQDGAAVSWREFVGQQPDVLVKTRTGIEMRPFNTVVGQ